MWTGLQWGVSVGGQERVYAFSTLGGITNGCDTSEFAFLTDDVRYNKAMMEFEWLGRDFKCDGSEWRNLKYHQSTISYDNFFVGIPGWLVRNALKTSWTGRHLCLYWKTVYGSGWDHHAEEGGKWSRSGGDWWILVCFHTSHERSRHWKDCRWSDPPVSGVAAVVNYDLRTSNSGIFVTDYQKWKQKCRCIPL